MRVEIVSRMSGFTVFLVQNGQEIERKEFLTLDGAKRYEHKLKNRYGL